MLSVVESQIKRAVSKTNINKNLLEILSKPMNEIKVNFPVKSSMIARGI